MIIRFLKLTLLLLLLVVSRNAISSHVTGTHISYAHVSGNTYMVTLTLYENCATAFQSSANLNIAVTNSCGFPTQNVSVTNVIYQQPVYSYCGAGSLSSCAGGNAYAEYLHVWQGTVTLPGTCTDWVFAYSLCCRATSVNLVGQGTNYVETTLNNTVSSNETVLRNALLAPSACAGQMAVYSPGFINPDGDSVVYAFGAVRSASGTYINYQAGFTANIPIDGATLNAQTGELSFSPVAQGSYVISIVAFEYALGVLKAKTTFEFTVVVVNCVAGNNAPVLGNIQNFNGTAQLVNDSTIIGCPGDTFCFNVTLTDPDVGATLAYSSTASLIYPGITTVDSSGTDTIVITFCGTFTAGSWANSFFTVYGYDNTCSPLNSIDSKNIYINTSNVYILNGDSVMYCAGDTVHLFSYNSSNPSWSSISGSPINTGVNFECDTCNNSWALPSVATTYVLNDPSVTSCAAYDTIYVYPAQTPVIGYALPVDSACINSVLLANSSSSLYMSSCLWTCPNAFPSASTSTNYTFAFTNNGYFPVTLEIDNGCQQTADTTFYVFIDSCFLSAPAVNYNAPYITYNSQNGILFIQSDHRVELTLFDLSGKLLYTQQVEKSLNAPAPVELFFNQTGIYIVRVTSIAGCATKQIAFIKQ